MLHALKCFADGSVAVGQEKDMTRCVHTCVSVCVWLLAVQGMMKGQELSEAYASADVFVMPSETETLGFVVLEAMASAVPVVAVAAGGLTDIISQDGKTGLLYSPGQLQSWWPVLLQTDSLWLTCVALAAVVD
jgi:glycosyltransferase involved in cell wall biosynthesis